MAKVAAHGTRIYLDEFNLSGYLNSSEMSVEQEVPIVTTFADAGPRRVVGNYDYENSEMGYFDGVDDAFDEQVHALLGSTDDHNLTKCWGSASEGGIAYDQVVRLTSKPLEAEVGGAVLLKWDSSGGGGIVRGHVLANVTSTGAEQRAGVNQGAKASGSTYAVVFRVLSFDGTNITLKVQESSDNGSGDAYADVAGLTSGALTGIGVVRATTTAALEAWRRVDISGTFNSALVLVTAGVVVGTS